MEGRVKDKLKAKWSVMSQRKKVISVLVVLAIVTISISLIVISLTSGYGTAEDMLKEEYPRLKSSDYVIEKLGETTLDDIKIYQFRITYIGLYGSGSSLVKVIYQMSEFEQIFGTGKLIKSERVKIEEE